MTERNPGQDPAAILESVEIPAWIETPQRAAEPRAARRLLEDYRPLAESLDRRIGVAAWRVHGPRAFIRGEVPYVVNNSGFSAAAVAELLYAHCEEVPAAGTTFHVLELGAGLGLFARQLLERFRDLCRSANRDHDRHLRYIVSDASAETVRSWRGAGLFSELAELVVTCRCDAERPLELEAEDGTRVDPAPLRMVVCNYVLDGLPAAIVRQGDGAIEQLHVRTWLGAEAGEGAAPAGSPGSAEDPASLLRVSPWLELEARFLPDGAARLPGVEALLAFRAGASRAILNFGAIASLDACLPALDPRGVVLVRDFGATSGEHAAQVAYPSRFGATWAMPIDFGFLAHSLSGSGWRVVDPPGDEERTIHTRLLARVVLPATEERFSAIFADPRLGAAEKRPGQASEHIAAGRMREALECYRAGLRDYPDDWNLLGQAAQFLNQQLLCHEQALALARRAAEINPAFSPFVWNTLGNCLFSLGRVGEAHDAYRRALAIDADDPQTHLNLAYTLGRRGETGEALRSIARGLAADRLGTFRQALLDKQRGLLADVDIEESRRRRAHERRVQALTGPVTPARPREDEAG